MKCPTCPVAPGETRECLGESVRRLCQLAAARPDYRQEMVRLAQKSYERPSQDTAVVALDQLLRTVSRCPHRGRTLPVSLQPECGCFERTECRAGRGKPPGAVTLQDCLACVTTGNRC